MADTEAVKDMADCLQLAAYKMKGVADETKEFADAGIVVVEGIKLVGDVGRVVAD